MSQILSVCHPIVEYDRRKHIAVQPRQSCKRPSNNRTIREHSPPSDSSDSLRGSVAYQLTPEVVEAYGTQAKKIGMGKPTHGS